MKRKQLAAALAILAALTAPWSIDGKEQKTVRATTANGVEIDVPIETMKAAENAAANKRAVTNKLTELFLGRQSPMLLTGLASGNFKEAAPEFQIIAGTDGMSTLLYRCRYVDPEFFTDALEAVISDSGNVELIKKLGSETNEYSRIVIRDKTEKMEELKKILISLDTLQPQVLVEAQVIEVYSEQGAERDVSLSYQYFDAEYGTTNKTGFNLLAPTQSRNSSEGTMLDFVPYAWNGHDGSTGRLSAAIRWINSSRNARILSAPNVIADQGAEATITTAEELPIPETAALSSSTNLSFKYKQVGVTLKITPMQINEKTVQLTVNPQVRSVLRYDSFTQNGVTSNIPVVSVRSVDTRLTVADGDIIILGGLYNSEKADSLRKIPYLGDIPVLGDLLNGRDSSSVDKQLIFLLKVHIIHPGKPMSLDPEETAEQVHQAAEILEQSRKLFTNKPASEFVDVERSLNEEVKDRKEKQDHERSVWEELKRFLMAEDTDSTQDSGNK